MKSQKVEIRGFLTIFALWWKEPDPYLRLTDPEDCVKGTSYRKGVQKGFPKEVLYPVGMHIESTTYMTIIEYKGLTLTSTVFNVKLESGSWKIISDPTVRDL